MAKKNPKNTSWWTVGSVFAFLTPEFFRLDSVWDFINAIPILGYGIDFIMTHHISQGIFWLFGALFLCFGIRRDFMNAKANKFEIPYGRWALIISGIIGIMLVAIFCSPPTLKISDINRDYETKFNDDKYDVTGDDPKHHLAQDGRDAFYAGNYGYAIMFFEQCETNAKNNPNNSWQANKPLLAAAIFHQNPTFEGYQQFTNSLNNLVNEIQKQFNKKSGRFTDYGVLSDTRQQVVKVKDLLLSQPEREYIQTSVIDRIDAIKSSHTKIY